MTSAVHSFSTLDNESLHSLPISVRLPIPTQNSLGQIFYVFIFPVRLRRNMCLSMYVCPIFKETQIPMHF